MARPHAALRRLAESIRRISWKRRHGRWQAVPRRVMQEVLWLKELEEQRLLDRFLDIFQNGPLLLSSWPNPTLKLQTQCFERRVRRQGFFNLLIDKGTGFMKQVEIVLGMHTSIKRPPIAIN